MEDIPIFKRKGLLSKFKYEKSNKTALLVNTEDEEQVKKILKKLKLDIQTMRLPEKEG